MMSALLFGAVIVAGQRTADDLKTSERESLGKYLQNHPAYSFLAETAMGEDVLGHDALVEMRKQYGKAYHPYYVAADFNRDKLKDFAVLVCGLATPQNNGNWGTLYEYQLRLVIFNGKRGGGYRVAFEHTAGAPLTSFLQLSKEKKPKLYWTVYETDASTAYTPAGKTYIAENAGT